MTLADIDDKQNVLEERIATPATLRTIHESFKANDEDSAANRAATQELVDFVPPYDPAELAARGQADRFNVNFGMVAAIRNEAVGAYHDLYTTPTALLDIKLKPEVDNEEKEEWAAIMSEEFTIMLRSWDAATPQMLLLNDLIVTHGVGITWFDDANNLQFEVSGMEDFNFDDDQVAIASKCEACTCERDVSVSKLWSKSQEKSTDAEGYTSEGWHQKTILDLIASAQPTSQDDDSFSYEKLQRSIKGNRIGANKTLPSINLVWGFIRELDGTYSVYAASNNNKGKNQNGEALESEKEEKWVFRKRHAYKDANQALQLFCFGIGNGNNIHTIRGLAYFLYEAGQADNVMKCKALDAARMRASEIYQPSGGIDSEEDMQFIDTGHAMIVPQSLKGVTNPAGQPLDRTFGVAQDITQEVMDRHSGGLGSQGVLQNPGARRNELQVAAELDHLSKLLNFAINLYYPPFQKLLRELVRRAFTETQTDLETMELVKDMKKRIVSRGVPPEMFSKIDVKGSMVSKVMGAGSRGSRMLIFTQMSELYPEMDDQGKERFSFDWATELVGHDNAVRYLGRPLDRRGHIDVNLARLENGRLSEGDYIEPVDGENKMVHLDIHIGEGLEPALAAVEEGSMTLEEFVTEHVTLFQHAQQTLEGTTVHKTGIPKLNSYRQRLQQVGEIIQNGLRQIAAEERKNAEQAQQVEGGPGQEGQEGQEMQEKLQKSQAELQMKQQETQFKMQTDVAVAMAKIEDMKRSSAAKIALDQAESMSKIAMLDKEAAAKVQRAKILQSAKQS